MLSICGPHDNFRGMNNELILVSKFILESRRTREGKQHDKGVVGGRERKDRWRRNNRGYLRL